MALAWIIYRTPDAVLTLMEDYRVRSLVWQEGGKLNNGWELRRPPRKSSYDVINEAVHSKDGAPQILQGPEAGNELLDYLKKGELIAYGTPRGDNKHQTIPEIEWHTIDTLILFDPNISPDDIGVYGEKEPRYSKVFVLPKTVISIWPSEPLGESLTGYDPVSRPPVAAAETTPVKSMVANASKPPSQKQAEIIEIVKKIYPNGRLPANAGKRNREIIEAAIAKNLVPPSDRNIRRALAVLRME